MIGSGLYLLTAISIHHKASAVAGAAGSISDAARWLPVVD
jgi:hypothetical protein